MGLFDNPTVTGGDAQRVRRKNSTKVVEKTRGSKRLVEFSRQSASKNIFSLKGSEHFVEKTQSIRMSFFDKVLRTLEQDKSARVRSTLSKKLMRML